ncbi:MAG: NAD(P)H-dependent oxidoreductase [Gammaproteobacteria bacterium]
MLIVDTALKKRADAGDPIRVGLVGAGYSGRKIAYQITDGIDGMEVVAIANRTAQHAREAYEYAGVKSMDEVASAADLDRCIAEGTPAISDDYRVLTESEQIEVIVDATGIVTYGAEVAHSAIEHAKHLILMNVEMDATVGAILSEKARAKGVTYSNSDGDEPGVAMNQIRFVRSIGLKPVVAGNLKGLYDPYRNPETQQAFAAANNQKPATMAHFADGTKLSMELTVLANGAGFGVAKRGMYGPALDHVNDGPAYYLDKLVDGGMVDFTVGAAPSNGAFVLGYSEDPMRADFLKYLKMGEGPLYCFYTPFHLPQLEIPNTIARAVLFGDAAVAPQGAPTCDSIAIAKKDLVPGELLDGLGGFCAYALIDNYRTSVADNCLPMGVSEGCTMTRAVAKDQPITYADVSVPEGRLVDQLRAQQNKTFGF